MWNDIGLLERIPGLTRRDFVGLSKSGKEEDCVMAAGDDDSSWYSFWSSAIILLRVLARVMYSDRGLGGGLGV